MNTSLNIVNLIENNPITRLSQEYNNKLIAKIQQNFTETQQKLFVSSFYCYLNYHPTNDYVIDLDNIWEWMGFHQKYEAKRALEKFFIIDTDYKFLLSQSAEQKNEGRGGHNKQTILLNIQTFKLFCIKSGTKKANEIHEYFIKLEEMLHQTVQEECEELKQQLEQKEQKTTELQNQLEQIKEENKQLQIKDDVPMMYIYNIDKRNPNPELKIGYTKNVNNRIKPYKQISKFGKLEFTIEVQNQNIRTIENFIHHLLSNYQIKDEIFRIDVEEAKMIIIRIVNTLKLLNITNESERSSKIAQTFESDTKIIENRHCDKISTREISTQTHEDDFIESKDQNFLLNNKDEHTKNFDKYIEDYCIVHPDVEVSGTDIIGQYRIVTQSASKEVFLKLNSYLSTRFKPTRLKLQNKNQVVNGFSGVKLKEIEYKKSLVNSDEQNFVFHACIFSPSGKVLFSDIVEEYKKWKNQIGKEWSEECAIHLKKYIIDTGYSYYTTIWANNGNGQGFYGLYLKKDADIHKTTSSTGKRVEKRNLKTNELLGSWETIAKAAESEQMCAAKMSRSIKNKTVFDDDYYYCSSNKTLPDLV